MSNIIDATPQNFAPFDSLPEPKIYKHLAHLLCASLDPLGQSQFKSALGKVGVAGFIAMIAADPLSRGWWNQLAGHACRACVIHMDVARRLGSDVCKDALAMKGDEP